MPREYPKQINCPTCGEACHRHCPSSASCGWYVCIAESVMHELGVYNPVSRKWKVRKTRRAMLR